MDVAYVAQIRQPFVLNNRCNVACAHVTQPLNDAPFPLPRVHDIYPAIRARPRALEPVVQARFVERVPERRPLHHPAPASNASKQMLHSSSEASVADTVTRPDTVPSGAACFPFVSLPVREHSISSHISRHPGEHTKATSDHAVDDNAEG